MSVSSNIDDVRQRLTNAAEEVGKNPKDIILVGVSKTQSIEKIREAISSGIDTFGENKVQELMEKYDKASDVKWHFIGHLQRNKVKYIIDKVEMIHSLDNIELASEIDKRAAKINRIVPVLIQINIGKEESKSGIYEEDMAEFTSNLKEFKNIVVSGIMTIPPASDNKEHTRKYFRRMREIFEQYKNCLYINFDFKYISMGMTEDFEVAVQEGANIIRIGTGIFGERVYN